MKINLLSDLHLECSDMDHSVPLDADVLILAGDISPDIDETLGWIYDTGFKGPIVYVAGNHEFYQYKIFPNHYDTIKEESDGCIMDVKFLQDDSVVIDGVRFIGSTLWTNFNLDPNVSVTASLTKAPMIMNDYFHILEREEWEDKTGYYSKKLQPETVLNAFNKSLDYIITELQKPFDGPTVVITHHGISNKSIHPVYLSLKNNEYFASDLDHIMLEHKPDVWVHGHTHQSIEYTIGSTRVFANPRGYAARKNNNENKTFDPNFKFEV